MLIGEYTHTLDPKKRVALPAKFRKELGKTVVITHGLDGCVFLYPLSTWKIISEELSGNRERNHIGTADSRGFNRFILAGAVEVDVDSAGRVLVPDFLKEFAGLKTRVVLAGVHNRVELWDEEAWIEYKKRIQKQADALAERLGTMGMI
jgi:MraZ protein